MQRILTIMPRKGVPLFRQMNKKVAEFLANNRGSFVTTSREKAGVITWQHKNPEFTGKLILSKGLGEVVVVELQDRSKKQNQWQLLSAFLGWLDRYFAESVESITIHYRGDRG